MISKIINYHLIYEKSLTKYEKIMKFKRQKNKFSKTV